MNNPAIYPPQHNLNSASPSPYPTGYGTMSHPAGMVQGQTNTNIMANTPPPFFSPNSFAPGGFPNQFQPQQQQQHQQRPPTSQPGFPPNQYAGFQRPSSQNSTVATGGSSFTQPFPGQQLNVQAGFSQHPQSQSHSHSQSFPNTSAPDSFPQSTTSASPGSMMAQAQSVPNPLAQQAQMQNAAQNARPVPQSTPTLSPQSQARERARVTVLLEINTVLLQEVVALQAKGMAGAAPAQSQQSPNSPTSNDPNAMSNSPVDAAKATGSKPASQEYADCMRRLQANLSYLANIADAKKKPQGQIPVGPAIMNPPPHLQEAHELYKKLNQLFPEASQSTINKAIALASAQGAKPPG
jgi:hypothetical protein